MRGKLMRLFFILVLLAFTTQLKGLTTQGNQIVDSNNKPVVFKGINWFGFNNRNTMVDGLWAGPDGLSLDFATVVYRMQLLGYNAVRLPFSFQDLFGLTPRNFTQNSATASQSQIQASVTNPSLTSSGMVIPPMVSPAPQTPGVVNAYLPNDTTLNRFLWVVNFFAKNGFYVLLDNHLREDQTVLQNPSLWVQDWVRLVTAISQDPISREKIMIDIVNEPDNFGIRWETSGNLPALKDLYLSAMDALFPINPSLLFFIEGTGQGGIGANWGDGFATDPTLIAQFGLSDPNPFFQALLQKSYLNQVVISPHIYPPSVTGALQNYTGTGLWKRLSSSFGYLTQQGYHNKIFPVALGEFGSQFIDQRDLLSMPDIASYLNNSDSASDGKHQAISSWFYWAWNANSGDTGGIVTNNWRDIIWQKIDYLTTIGLLPWYFGNNQIKYGTLSIIVTPTDGLSSNDLKPITANNYSFAVTSFNTPISQSVPVGEYKIIAPQIIASGYQFDAEPQNVSVLEGQNSVVTITYHATPLPPSQNTCTVEVQLGSPWQEGPGSAFKNVVNLYIKDDGANDINVPWTITLHNPSYQNVASAWNVNVSSIQAGVITGNIQANWETLKHNDGNTVNIGMIISSSSSDFMPTKITINGTPCTVIKRP